MSKSETTTLEAAFNEAAEWIKAGEVTGEFGGNPYRWRRGPWRFDQMSQSPSGRFSCINGPEFVAYLRPDARPASGFMGRVDLRAKATPELLLGLPQKLASESGENDTNPWAKPMEEWDIGDVERAIDMETTIATPTDPEDLAKAVKEFEMALPGWWWSVTHCVWTRDADCGPDGRVLGMEHPHVLAFDDGFHEAHKGTLADALRSVMRQAQEAINGTTHQT